ncbi:MAG TPA: MarR family transcriptional regulator [Micromonosporaceae bacterium]|nr:MarR family transcriptional regulator [Micromonosporaceae bacterium]
MTTPAEPRWLNDRERHAWLSFLATKELLEDALDRQLQRDANLPHAYYQVLAMLSESPGRALRMSQLAEITNSSPSRISHAVARLEDAGWVERRKTPTDKRGSVAALTDAGFAALAAAAPGHVGAVRHFLFDALTTEQVGQLTAICAAALGRLDPDGAIRRSRFPQDHDGDPSR